MIARLKDIDKLKVNFDNHVGDKKIICDTNIFLPPIFNSEHEFRGDNLFDFFSDPLGVDCAFFKETLREIQIIQKSRLEFDRYLISKSNLFIYSGTFSEIRDMKHFCNVKRRENKKSFYLDKFTRKDVRAISELEKIFDEIPDKKILHNPNGDHQKIYTILDKNSKKFGFARRVSEVDKALSLYCYLGYCVVSNDYTHVHDLIRNSYFEIKRSCNINSVSFGSINFERLCIECVKIN